MSEVFSKNQKIIVHVPLHVRKWGGKRVVVGPQGQDLRHLDLQIRKDEKLLKALARSYRWQKHLLTGSIKTWRRWRLPKKSTNPTCNA
jgi:GTPase Era involved in 16S rRNA processing